MMPKVVQQFGGYYVIKLFDAANLSGTNALTSDEVSIGNTILDSFCVYLYSAGGTPEVITEYTVSFDKANESVQPDGNHTQIIGANTLKSTWYRESFTPEFGRYLRIKLKGGTTNATDTVVTCYLCFQKRKFIEP